MRAGITQETSQTGKGRRVPLSLSAFLSRSTGQVRGRSLVRRRSAAIGLLRLVGIVGVFASLVAIGLAQLEPAPAHFRVSSAPHFGVINGFVLESVPTETRLLDPDTGALQKIRLPEGDRIDYGSFSPWQDDEGEYQVVGRWSRIRGQGTTGLTEEFGVARYSMPSGRLLDHIATEVVPSSHPCWYPGNRARVLYAGSDGQLYRIAFDAPRARTNATQMPHPIPITWDTDVPGKNLILRDPVWPTDPRFAGKLLVSVCYRRKPTDTQLLPGQIWWIQLSEDGDSVVKAGPLSGLAGTPGARDMDARYPNAATMPDGQIALGYLIQSSRAPLWHLHLTSLSVDPKTGALTADASNDRVLTSEHLAALPPFSTDARTIFGVVHEQHNPMLDGLNAKIVRFPTLPERSAAATKTVAQTSTSKG